MANELKDDTKEEIKLTPTNDFIFKRIFGKEGNEEITKDLLSSILEDKIETIELSKEQTTDVDVTSDKIGILDVEVKLSSGTIIDLEMQVAKQRDIEKRLLFYWSKLYSSNVKSGEEYGKLKRVVIIMFSEFNLENLIKIPKYHTEWKLREKNYVNQLLTNDIEIDIIEMKKLDQYIKNGNKIENKKLANWIKFLTNPDELGEDIMENVKEIKMAKEELEKIRQDAHDKRVAELREKYIRDQKAIEGYGYDKGEKNKAITIAKNLLERNVDVEFVKESTGLSNEEIQELLHDKRVAELREKYIRDQKAIEGYGYDKGLEEGLAKGEKKRENSWKNRKNSRNC